MLDPETIRSLVEQEGLVYLGFLNLCEEARYAEFQQWLADKKHGEMSYLENHAELRRNPQLIVPGGKSAVVFALPYKQGDRLHSHTQQPRIAQYARLQDYHKVLKIKGQRVLASLLKLAPHGHSGRVLVDSAPLLERALAERTLSGFLGKNTMFIHPEWGSYLLLAEIFLTWDLETLSSVATHPESKSCGTCRRCQVFCPTGALTPYSLDATKCLAYYTIEHRGPIPVKYWAHLKTYVFGCDICQLVCPFNRGVPLAKNLAVKLAEFPPLSEVALMDQTYYERSFGGTPMTRAKRSGLRRNALIAMIVTEDPNLPEVLAQISQEGDTLLTQTLEQIAEYERLQLCEELAYV